MCITKYKGGRQRLPESTIKAIHEFYNTAGIKLPDKKLVTKKSGLPTSILDKSITVLHHQFNKHNPERQVGIATFYKHRPRHVKTQRQAKYRGCLCEYCENITLKLKVVNGQLSTVNAPTIRSIYHISNITMCEKESTTELNNP